MLQLLKKILAGVLVLAALTYAADYISWRVRLARGSGMGAIQVDMYLATALKGNKAEYDYLGSQPQPCARALFPHGGSPPCWWLAHHTDQWQ
jgi:hypothetical protein